MFINKVSEAIRGKAPLMRFLKFFRLFLASVSAAMFLIMVAVMIIKRFVRISPYHSERHVECLMIDHSKNTCHRRMDTRCMSPAWNRVSFIRISITLTSTPSTIHNT
ncbi:hypothetical protein RF11_08952 [Thelohanellus kitauei]|uniref:Uncharacterized protein n=1 Tax=Thelohanellus kitauei TaxID=669202 RepID=A0A0C2MMB5_THEKT|nr:hypothetical protein RF11_08952 [Thelohanellus kitauei]